MPKHPWTAVPAARSSYPVLRIKFAVIVVFLGLAVISGPLSLVLAGRSAPTPIVDTDEGSPSVSFAEVIARDFLAGRPTKLPTAEGVDAEFGFIPVGEGEARPTFEYLTLSHSLSTSATVMARTLETHYFRVHTETGLYNLTVVTGLAEDGYPVLAAQPILAVGRVAGTKTPAYTYAGVEGEADTIAEPVRAVIVQWAQAYAASNGDELRRIAADPSEGAYTGLGGFTADEAPQVISAYVDPAQPEYLIVRVRVVFSQDASKGFRWSGDFDLLVTNHTTAVPNVAAWGAAGAGPSLAPYANNSTSS